MAAKNDINNFAKRMGLRAKEVEEGVNKIVRVVALVADQTVVLATPVDTGRARSNWLVSLNIPLTATREPYSPGNSLGLGERENANAQIQHAAKVFEQRKLGDTIYITNNLDYIVELNNGWSKQAPANYVAKAIQAAAKSFRGKRVRIFVNR